MKVEQILNCSFTSWYPTFKKHTWKSIIIPLCEEFVKYLKTDGVVLPDGSLTMTHAVPSDNESDEETEEGWDDEGTTAEAPSFPLLDAEIKEAITKLGGSIFPKLNWSCAKDATWISLNNSLKCVCVGDIYLLLKSSEFISHDLSQPFKDCEDSSDEHQKNVKYVLVLRKWVSMNPAMEFRCFVKDGVLIGISQRDYTNYYHHISLQRNEILQDITSYYDEVISEKFPDNNYTFDVYREAKDRVKLVDFNPFGRTTDPLLFDWDQLENLQVENQQKPLFQFVNNEVGVQPNPYRYYALPRDFVHLSTGEDPYKLIDFLNLRSGAGENNDVSSSEDEQS